MPWATTLSSAAAIFKRSDYIESRTDPDDEDKEQVQVHTVLEEEYRGLTWAAAYANCAGSYGALKKITCTMFEGAGGGWTLTRITDTASGTWITLKARAMGNYRKTKSRARIAYNIWHRLITKGCKLFRGGEETWTLEVDAAALPAGGDEYEVLQRSADGEATWGPVRAT